MLPSREDVRRAYHFFLGRDPELEQILDQKLRVDWPSLLRDFIGSPEFLVRVRDQILSLDRPTGALFDRPPSPDLCSWAARRMPLNEAAGPLAAASASWMDLYYQVFGDSAFRRAVSPVAELRPPFLEHLDALRHARTQKVGEGHRPALQWLLVTGAPRSGTTLLRALLAKHPNVALLQEYGLSTLIDRIEALVRRPSRQAIDWDEEDTGGFEKVASFYRAHPSRDAEGRDDGQLDLGHFEAAARAIFSVLAPVKTLRVIGDKLPMSEPWENVPRLFERLPSLQILVIVRDPAEVVKSSLIRREATRRGRDGWPIKTVQEAVAQWVRAWQLTRTLKARYPYAVHVLKYEDLCADPAGTLACVDAVLGLAAHAPDIPIETRPPHLSLMTATETMALMHLVGPVTEDWPRATAEDLMKTHAQLPVPYAFGERLSFADEATGLYLVSGFSVPEAQGRWTVGVRARIALPHGMSNGIFLIELWITRTEVDEQGRCDFSLQAGGEPKLFTFGEEGGRAACAVAASDGQDRGTLVIDLIVAKPNPSGDDETRVQGLCIEALRVTHLMLEHENNFQNR